MSERACPPPEESGILIQTWEATVLECDLIMKGGITSGVVYPHAILEIAREYRLRSIGGTSAGAIAAAFAAAAEYRRQSGGGMAGYDEIGGVASELGTDMGALFQPTPALRPLFNLLLASVSEEARKGGKAAALGRAVLAAFRGRILAGAAVMALGIVLGVLAESVWLALLCVVLGMLAAAGLVLHALYRLIFVRLPREDFGICPGLTIDRSGKQGFADWMADKIDLIAGNVGADGRPGRPLTAGQLARHGVTVATMTTDLSSQRPYQLPLQTDIHYFSRSEFERLFAPRIVDYLCETGGRREPSPDDPHDLPRDLHKLPVGDDFPVLLVARMSLSFPGLIRAVPLYRVDYQRRQGGTAPLRRCLFSDGGISSNFPIHFFDALLPSRPTFGIALADWEKERHGDERIDLPRKGRQSTSFAVRDIPGIGGFLFAILNTAKDWQDSMQSLLPGYAERIVTIRLDDSREGGMNLAMDKGTIATLVGYGRDAGQRLVGDFRMDQHRYDRAISLLPELEGSLTRFAAAYRNPPTGAPEGALTYREVLTEFDTAHYKNPAEWRVDPFARLADDLAKLGERAAELRDSGPRETVAQGTVPATDARIRLVAIADRVPRNRGGGEGEEAAS